MSSRSRSRSNEAPKSKKIYISNLSAECTQNDLRTKFGDFGTISEVNVKEKNGVYFAFVEFESHNEALKAVDSVNQKQFQDKVLKVEIARGRPAGGYNNRFGGGGFGGSRGGRDNYRNNDYGERRGGNRDRQGGDRNGGSQECYNCHGFGHYARDCTKPRQQRDFRGGDRDRGDRGDRERGDRGDRQRGGNRDYDKRRDYYDRRDRSTERDQRRDRGDRGDRGNYERRDRRRSNSGDNDKRRKQRNDDY